MFTSLFHLEVKHFYITSGLLTFPENRFFSFSHQPSEIELCANDEGIVVLLQIHEPNLMLAFVVVGLSLSFLHFVELAVTKINQNNKL